MPCVITAMDQAPRFMQSLSYGESDQYLVDALSADSQTLYVVKIGLRDLRGLTLAIIDVAHLTARNSKKYGVVILEAPLIGDERVKQEWQKFIEILNAELGSHLSLIVRRFDKASFVLGRELHKNDIGIIEEAVSKALLIHVGPESRKRRVDSFFEIFKVLAVNLYRKKGSLTLKELGEQTGFSYPTVARALDQLKPWLIRHSDRQVELRSIPAEVWTKLVLSSDTTRASLRYTDRSGRPRSAEALLEKLHSLNRSNIAVGGVPGAKHYYPGLDIVGIPRLDLIIHSPGKDEISTIARQLDPALELAERGEPARVVFHVLSRPESFFSTENNDMNWADEVECLLDLHDARLESQAVDLQYYLMNQTKA